MTPAQVAQLECLIEHYGVCCAQNAAWDSRNRVISVESRATVDTTKAKAALLAAIDALTKEPA